MRNPGSNPVTRVQIVATVPEQMIVTRAGGASEHRKEGQKILYEPLTIPAGAEVNFRIDVQVQRPGDESTHVSLDELKLELRKRRNRQPT